MKCPACDGKGEYFAHCNRGDSPHTWEYVQCFRCKGSGDVPNIQSEWIKKGKYIDEWRYGDGTIDGMYTMRQASEILGFSSLEISQAETGRIDPTAVIDAIKRHEEDIKNA